MKEYMCNHCGEIGAARELRPDHLHSSTDPLFVVECYRDAKLCCQSFAKPTQAEALAEWKKMWDGPEVS